MTNIQTISALVENDAVFQCSGYSEINISYRDIDDNDQPCTKVKTVRVPIKTAGVLEFQEQMTAKAPRPPVTTKIIRAGTPEANEYGIDKDFEIVVFDHTDEAYVDALDKHNRDFIWRVAVFAIDVEWKKQDGTTVELFEDRKMILASTGISGPQLDRIYQDIIKLARFREDREDFLSGSSLGSMKTSKSD